MRSESKNKFVFFYAYFVAAVIFVYVHTYLPLYFFNILNVDRTELAFIQVFSYSALFIKPVISIYFNKRTFTSKALVIVSVIIILVSFIFFVFSLLLLIVFGIFLGINLAFLSIMDVFIDKLLLQQSTTSKEREKNSMIIQMGGLIGAIVPVVFYMMIFGELTDTVLWVQLFILGIIVIAPMIPLVFLLNIQIVDKEEVIAEIRPKIDKMIVFLICIFMFFYMANGLYEYPLEPWIYNKYC